MKKRDKIIMWSTFALVMLVPFLIPLRPPAVHAQTGAQNGSQYRYISTATTTVVKNGFGYLNAISINGGTGGVVSLYDVPSSSCTGTPGSGKFAAVASTSVPVTLRYELAVINGICVVTAAATDVTVSYN